MEEFELFHPPPLAPSKHCTSTPPMFSARLGQSCPALSQHHSNALSIHPKILSKGYHEIPCTKGCSRIQKDKNKQVSKLQLKERWKMLRQTYFLCVTSSTLVCTSLNHSQNRKLFFSGTRTGVSSTTSTLTSSEDSSSPSLLQQAFHKHEDGGSG